MQEYIKELKSNFRIELIIEIFVKIYQRVELFFVCLHDLFFDSRKIYTKDIILINPLDINCAEIDCSGINIETAHELWRMYKSHRFDLLGSGWVKCSYAKNANGLEGNIYEELVLKCDEEGIFLKRLLRKTNLDYSIKIWREIEGQYEAIDWQKDFKSGYRWDSRQWYRPIFIPNKKGVDIKVPWELGRLQHLPRLAILYQILLKEKEDIYQEFRNQLLDFISQNPIRMGVNYMCTMDVGIRNANIVLAVSLFKNFGVVLDEEFEKIITNYIYEQCQFIEKNLEYSVIFTGNHYFANLAGLLFGSAVLPTCQKQQKWLKFSIKEIEKEILKQFNIEGTNKEASTAYHRLMGEMALYSVGLIYSLFKQGKCNDLQLNVYDILYKSGRFLKDIKRADGSFTQIGDNDSGVFFRLSITGLLRKVKDAKQMYSNLTGYVFNSDDFYYLDENMNDGSTFLAAAAALFESQEFDVERAEYPLEYSLLKTIVKSKKRVSKTRYKVEELKNPIEYQELLFSNTHILQVNGKNLLENIEFIEYSQFGVYIFRSNELYLCINATDNGQNGKGGHAHNDKLSFELFVNNQCIFEDAGSFLYTPIEEERNYFRSVCAHNTIYVGSEQNKFTGFFSMKCETYCRVISKKSNEIEVEVKYDKCIHRRKFEIHENYVSIYDKCNINFKTQFRNSRVTRGYGKLINNTESKE